MSKRSVKLRSQKRYSAKPKPARAERRSINARVTAKPTLATGKKPLKQHRLQRYTAKAKPVFKISHLVRGNEHSRNLATSLQRSRNAQKRSGGVTGPKPHCTSSF